jgi:hypothetical protein
LWPPWNDKEKPEMISPEILRRYPFFSSVKDDSLKKIAMISEEEEASE